MVAEIIAVGTELLMGQIVNTDSQYLARRLNKYGIDLYHQVTVGDNKKRLIEAIAQAARRADIVILSGGLGPTEDDLTKDAVAEFLGVPMVRDEASANALAEYFAASGKIPTPNNFRQTDFPQGATIMANDCGTAPGCICKKDGVLIAVFPGPPVELQAMFESKLEPYLASHMDKKFYTRIIRVFGMGESTVEHVLREIIDNQTNPTIAPYASLGEMSLRVTAGTGMDGDPASLVMPVVNEIKETIGDFVYSDDNEELPHLVVRLLKERKLTIAIAESVTGGMVASSVVDIPGASETLMEGVVTYTDEAKIRLGVSAGTISEHTAVSWQVAAEMADCIRRRAGTDVAVSTTGVAGPGPDKNGNPAGLVYVGYADEKGKSAYMFKVSGNRARVRNVAALHAFDTVRRALLKN